jgi:glycosyltransferase 2 family protein
MVGGLAVGSRAVSLERVALFTVIPVAAVLAVATLIVGGPSLADNFKRIGGMLGVFLLLGLWQNAFRFLRWLMFGRRIGVPLGVTDGTLFYAAGCGLTLTPGRIGELLRLWLIEKRFGTPYRRSIALYVADRISDADSYLVLFGSALALRQTGMGIGWAALVIVAAVNLCLFFPQPALGALGALYRVTRRGKKLLVRVRRLVRNCAGLFKPAVFLPGLALGVVGWGAVPVVLVLALGRLGIDLAFPTAMMICAAASLTGGSTMLPGGGGSTEAAMVLLLHASGVPLDAAVTATIATRLAFLWLPVGLGLVALPVALRAVRLGERAAPARLADAGA